MHGAQHREVPVVERHQSVLAKTLHEREHARVNHAQRLLCVLLLQCLATLQIVRRGRLQPVDAIQQIAQEDHPRLGPQAPVAPVVQLGEHQQWHDQVLAGVAQQLRAALVVGVGGVECRQQRAGVKYQGHRARSSRLYASDSATGSAVSAAAERPSVDFATPNRGRRLARSESAFSSIASASTTVRATPRRCASASSVSSEDRRAATVVRRMVSSFDAEVGRGLMVCDA